MVHIIGEQNSIANQFLFELRDKVRQQDQSRFRANLERLGKIMAYEISKKMKYESRAITTPLDTININMMVVQPVLISILRAGLPYFAGFQNFFDKAESGFVGAYRREVGNEVEAQLDYVATPNISGRDVILIDPMLATGGSIAMAVQELSRRGQPNHIYIACVVASPEGIQHLKNEIELPFSIWTFAVDDRLNHQFYIVPGLGDAGDLSFGAKL